MASITSAQDFFVSIVSPEPLVSRAKALSTKRREKGYGDESGILSVSLTGDVTPNSPGTNGDEAGGFRVFVCTGQ